MNCRTIEPLLTAYIDGLAGPADRAAVELHVSGCPACQAAAAAQRAASGVLRARGAALVPAAPPGLATRLAALARHEAAARPALGMWGRLGALASAAAVVLTLGAGLFVATSQSTVVLAAQLALDHVKCFLLDGHDHLPTKNPEDAEAFIQARYGWTVDVPPSRPAEGFRLVASRKCLLGDGFAAHLLYRADGQPVSVFILPGDHAAHDLRIFGAAVEAWSANGRTYVVVVEGRNGNSLARVASYVRDEAQ
ncbi:MAG: zf-HC2 domain-containing protein [Acidobacteriota bacterium]